MPFEALIATGTLNEDRRVRETLGEDFATDVVETNAMANHSSARFTFRRSVDIRQRTETKTIGRVRIAETVDLERIERRVKRLADALVQFVVMYGTPEGRFSIGNRRGLHTYERRSRMKADRCASLTIGRSHLLLIHGRWRWRHCFVVVLNACRTIHRRTLKVDGRCRN